MCYGENGTVKFLKTLADNALRHTGNYSMMQIKKKMNSGTIWVTQAYTLKSHLSFAPLYCDVMA
jgi:hypothetical protein